MTKQATKRTKDLKVRKDGTVKGGFFGSLIKPVATVVKTTPPLAK